MVIVETFSALFFATCFSVICACP